jgi:hypothetical protein
LKEFACIYSIVVDDDLLMMIAVLVVVRAMYCLDYLLPLGRSFPLIYVLDIHSTNLEI